MAEKEDDNFRDIEDEPDFSSLNKYFREDDSIQKNEPVKIKTITEDVSISGPSFRAYENEKEIANPKIHQKIEKKGSQDKIDFLKSLDEDSLTLDICASVNKNWNRK